MRKTKPTPARAELLDLHWGQGKPHGEIATLKGVSKTTVAKWFRERHLGSRTTGPRTPDEERDMSKCEKCDTMLSGGQRVCDACQRKRHAEYQREYVARGTPLKALMKRNKANRTCLKCDRVFESEGAWNRICPICKSRAAVILRTSQARAELLASDRYYLGGVVDERTS